MLQRTAVIMVF